MSILKDMLKNLYREYTKKYRSLSYILILILIFVFTYCISRPFFGFYIGFNITDPDSARYLLSTLIQSEAAILAIVITLSLVAVQQTASSYSPRVIEVFKDWKSNPDFYILMATYLISMVYGIWVLKQIGSDKSGNIVSFDHSFFNSFETHIWFSYTLGIFSFFSLVPYIRNTLDLLKPSNIIEKISEKISQETIKSFVFTRMKISDDINKMISQKTNESLAYTGIKEDNLYYKTISQKTNESLTYTGIEKDNLLSAEKPEESEIKNSRVASFQRQSYTKNSLTEYESFELSGNSDDNPIQQIFDILVSSQIKHDSTTSKYGLLKVIARIETFTEGKIDPKFHPEIVKSFRNFAIFSLILVDSDSSLSLVHYLEKIGIKAVEQKIEPVVNIVLSSLTDISIVGTEQKMEDIAIGATLSIRNIGIKTLNEDLITTDTNEDPFNVIVTGIEMNLRFIGKKAAELKLEKETLFVVRLLRDIGMESINRNLKFDIRQSIKYLEEIGKLSIRQELEMSISMVGIILNEIGTEVLKLDPGDKASKEELSEFETLIVSTLYSVGMFSISAAEHKFELSAKNTLITLKDIGIYVARRKFETATKGSLSLIRDIGIQLIKQEINSDSVVKDVSSYLREIGEISIKNDMYEQTIDAISFIDQIGNIEIRKNIANSILILSSFNIIGVIAIKKSPSCEVDKDLRYIVNKIITFVEKFGIAAVEQKMYYDANNCIEVLKDLAYFSIDLKSECYITNIIQSIEEIGTLSVGRKLRNSIEKAAISIREIGSKAIQVKLNQIAYQSQSSLENILALAIDTKLFNHSIILESLEELKDNIKAYDDTINTS